MIYLSTYPINFVDKSYILIDNEPIFINEIDKSLILYDINKYLNLGETNKHWSIVQGSIVIPLAEPNKHWNIITYKEKAKSLTIYTKPNLSFTIVINLQAVRSWLEGVWKVLLGMGVEYNNKYNKIFNFMKSIIIPLSLILLIILYIVSFLLVEK